MTIKDLIKTMHGNVRQIIIHEKSEIGSRSSISDKMSKEDFIKKYGGKNVDYWKMTLKQIIDFNNDCEIVLVLNIFIGEKDDRNLSS